MEERALKYDMTQGPIGKKLVLFFLPIAVGTIFQQLYTTVDAAVVGRFVGKEALAAVGGSTAQVIALCIGFFVALTGGASAVIAQLMGARRGEDVSKAVHSALSFSVLAGLVLTLVGIPVTPALLHWMKTPADTLEQAVLYLRIYFAGAVFMLLFNMGSSILRAVGDSRRPFLYLVVCCVCNIALDLIFVVQLHMGVAGAAWATVISQLLSSVLVMIRLCMVQEVYQVRLSRLRIHGRVTWKMLRIGIPTGLQESMYNVANVILQIAINTLGTVATAGWAVTIKVDGIYCAVSSALGVAIMSFAGQNFGAGRMDRVKQVFRSSMLIFTPITLVVGGLLLWMSQKALFIFTDDAAVMDCARQIIGMLVPFYVVWTLVEAIGGILRGVGDAVLPFVITCIGVCVVRMVWVVLVFPQLRTVRGLLACWPLSWLITAIALVVYYKRGSWVKKVMPDEQEEQMEEW